MFHLKREGVRPIADAEAAAAKRAPVVDDEPIAGGAYAIAGPRTIRGCVWRFPAFNAYGRRSH